MLWKEKKKTALGQIPEPGGGEQIVSASEVVSESGYPRLIQL
jgi:hypothetical protein